MGKKDIELSQDLNVGLFNSGQLLYQLSHWSYGIEAEFIYPLTQIDSQAWCLTRISTQVLFTGTSELINSSSHLVSFIGTNQKHF